MISIIKLKAYPLTPPNGRIEPSNAASGSVVGFPSLSIAVFGGISSPFLFASKSFPLALTAVAISTAI